MAFSVYWGPVFYLISLPSLENKKNEINRATYDGLIARGKPGHTCHLAPRLGVLTRSACAHETYRGRARARLVRGAGSWRPARGRRQLVRRAERAEGPRDAAAPLLGSAVARAPAGAVLR